MTFSCVFLTKILVIEREEDESLAVISLLRTGFHIKDFMQLRALSCITVCVLHYFLPANFYNLKNADDTK